MKGLNVLRSPIIVVSLPIMTFHSGSGDSTCAIVGGVLGVLLCVTIGIVVFLVIKVRRLTAERGTFH